MILLSWQFKMLDHKFPDIATSAYFDDRNFRGEVDKLVELDEELLKYDIAAGRSTYLKKQKL